MEQQYVMNLNIFSVWSLITDKATIKSQLSTFSFSQMGSNCVSWSSTEICFSSPHIHILLLWLINDKEIYHLSKDDKEMFGCLDIIQFCIFRWHRICCLQVWYSFTTFTQPGHELWIHMPLLPGCSKKSSVDSYKARQFHKQDQYNEH